MNPRILMAVVVGLVLVAFGGFYFALGLHANDALLPPALPPAQTATPVQRRRAACRRATAAAPGHPGEHRGGDRAVGTRRAAGAAEKELRRRIRRVDRGGRPPAQRRRVGSGLRPGTGRTLRGDHARQIEIRRRGEHADRSTSSPPTRRACFMRSAPRARAFASRCSARTTRPPATATPESVRQLMRLGTLYRFQAIAEGMPAAKPAAALTSDEMRAFEASLAREGLNFKDVSTGRLSQQRRHRTGKALPDAGDASSGDRAAGRGHAPQDLRRNVLSWAGQVSGLATAE